MSDEPQVEPYQCSVCGGAMSAHTAECQAHSLHRPTLSELADFSRQLETELQTMTALADRLAEALQSVLGDSWNGPLPDYARHTASAIRVAYENHKKQTP